MHQPEQLFTVFAITYLAYDHPKQHDIEEDACLCACCQYLRSVERHDRVKLPEPVHACEVEYVSTSPLRTRLIAHEMEIGETYAAIVGFYTEVSQTC